jgi:hypothetical protein
VVAQREKGLTYDKSEQGIFQTEYFPDYVIETIPHVPWALSPICPPKAIVATLIKMINNELAARKYKMSWSSYHSQMFAVAKPKGGI